MCCEWENPSPRTSNTYLEDSRHPRVDMNHLTVVAEDSFASLLDLAANNDLEGFKRSIEHDPCGVDEVELWYGRQKGSKQMVSEERTPLMVASMYGSIDVIKLILSSSDADVNRVCGSDKSTALHCAASGGAVNVVNVVKLLLAAGADVNVVDANGHFPVDVIDLPPKVRDVKLTLEEHLGLNSRVSAVSDSNSSPLFNLQENGPLSSCSDSPMKSRPGDSPFSSASEKKEYPIDPSFPDIKSSIYSTDEFRMYSFKVRPCSRAYTHDWTECPFVHPGENARRRDPRKFHYSCVPCPEFRKGTCRSGDMCEYAHGVFESWLHPAQYRIRLCKEGTSCDRRVCFFAHTPEELRPLFVSTGSAVPSPRSSGSSATAMDFAAAMSFLPGSPSSVSAMSQSPFTPPMSPSNVGWPQPNIPALHLPGSNLQSSRLRSSLNARDILAEDFDVQQHQLMNELSGLTQPSMSSISFNQSGQMKPQTQSNLNGLFSAESSSPQYNDQMLAAVFSPTHKSALLNQFQQQQSMLSPINTNFYPKNIEHPLLQASLSGRMSPRNVEPISPMSSWVSMLAQREKLQEFRSLSSRELIVGSPVNSRSECNGKPDCAVNANGLGKHCRSSFDVGNGNEPDLSWVQSLVKESPSEIKEKIAAMEDSTMNSDPVDNTALGAWLDQLVAQQN